MATTNGITNAIAVRAAYEFMLENGYTNSEVLAKLEKHLATLEKPRPKAEGPSKSARENLAAATEWASKFANKDAMAPGEFAAMEDVSIPKATAILKAGIAAGIFEDIWVEGNHLYKVA